MERQEAAEEPEQGRRDERGDENQVPQQDPAAREGQAHQQREQWSEQEWQEWNSWWNGRWSWERDAWGHSDWVGSGERSQSAGRWRSGGSARQGVATGATAPGESGARSAEGARGWQAEEEPWSQYRTRSWQDSGWWGSQKGDYADPPGWGGWRNYRLWKRSVVCWNTNTDVAMWRRAEKLLKTFDWEL